MKKLLLSLTAILTGGMLFAQTVTVPDFTVTDTDGGVRNLYTELNLGHVVIVDFFFNTCGFCISNIPIIEQIYQDKGAGNGNVDIWSINIKGNTESTASVKSVYKDPNNVTNPCFGGQQSRDATLAIFFAFNTSGGYIDAPAYTVICPNKKGWYNVNYPTTLTGFDTYISQCGVSTSGVYNIVRDETQARFVSIYPNPSNNASKIDFFLAERTNAQITIFNLLGEQINVLANEAFDAGTHTLDFSSANLTAGNYLVKMTTEKGVVDVAKFIMVKE